MARAAPIDRGYAWVITFAVFCCNILCVGFFRAFGVFFVEIIDTFHSSSSLTSLIMGVQNAVCCLTALVVHNVLLDVIEVRSSAMFGGFVMALGMMLGMFAFSVPFLTLTLGVLVGLGNGFTYGPGIVLLGDYFRRRRVLANALASMGASVGSMTLPALATYLVIHYGLRGALLLYGAVTFHICVFASFYRPLSQSDSQLPDGSCTNDLENGEESDKTLLEQPFGNGHEISGKESHPTFLIQSGKNLSTKNVASEKDVLTICSVSSSKSDSRKISDSNVVAKLCPEDYFPSRQNDPVKLLSRNCLKEHRLFSSAGNMCVSKTSLYDNRKRSLTVADLRMQPSHPCDRVHDLGSQLRLRLENAMLHLSQPYLPAEPMTITKVCHEDKAVPSEPNDVITDDVNCDKSGDENSGNRGRWGKLCQHVSCNADLLRVPMFWLVQSYVCVGVMGATGAGFYMAALMQEKGLNKNDTALTLTIWGVVNLLGRLLSGVVADRKVLRPANISALAFVGIAILFAVVSFLPHTLGAWIVFSAVFGLLEGSYFSMLPDIIVNFVGRLHFSRTFGFAQLSQGAFSAILFPVLGVLKDVTGNYHATFYLLGACALVASSLLILVPFLRYLQRCWFGSRV